MSVLVDMPRYGGCQELAGQLIFRIAAETALLRRARRWGDHLQEQISTAELHDLFAVADRHDIPPAPLL